VLRPGFEPGSPARKASIKIDWLSVRERFIEYLGSISYNKRTVKDVLSYLDRYVTVLNEPFDVVALFNRVERGKRHLVLGLRKLFSFYEVLGWDKSVLDGFRKALPRVRCGVDVRIPSESRIVASLRRLERSPVKYQALYDLLLDSGLRLIEAVQVVNDFERAERVNGFYRCEVGMFRGEKQAYYAHFTEHTFNGLTNVKGKLDDKVASVYFRKACCVAPKYVRKYVFDKMIELEIPESVADFIEGRVARRVGAKHYLALARQASRFYPRYARHVQKRRS